jgi:cytochrome c6
MKKLIQYALLAVTLLIVSFNQPAWAGDAGNGAKIFTANCAACHAGGKNVVNGAKTLQKADLEKNAMTDIKAITAQVIKGKNAMPAFLGRLSDQDIEDVATYVLSQAENGWAAK